MVGYQPSRRWLSGVVFPLHVLACMVLGVFNTGGGCGPANDLPPTSVVCKEQDTSGLDLPPDPNLPFVWLGTTTADGAYRAIEPNETLGVITGPQGGSHVWGAARLYTPAGGLWVLEFALKDAEGAQLAGVNVPAEACAGGTIEVTYVTVYLEANPPVSGILSVTAKPSEGPADAVSAEVPIAVQ